MTRRRLPAAVWECLEHPQRVTVYSIHPEPANFEALMQDQTPPAQSDPTLFRGYRIVGQTDLTATSDRERAATAVERSAAAVFADAAMCFEPRHGVRVSDGKATFDFVICYDCRRLLCCEGDKTVAYLPAGDSPTVLNALLLAAHVPTEKASEEN